MGEDVGGGVELARRLSFAALNQGMEQAVNFACRCNGVGFGTYANSTPMWTPWRRDADGKHYCATIDACIAPEIASLWALGIKTTNSCCGHRRGAGWISVYDESIEAMRELGCETIHGSRPEIFYSAGSRRVEGVAP